MMNPVSAPGEEMPSDEPVRKYGPMDTTAILAVVDEALDAANGASGDEASVEARGAAIAARHPAFAEGYPRLLHVACSSTTPERAAAVRQLLPMMLAQMREIDASSATFESASKTVGLALGDRFLPVGEGRPHP